MTIFFWNFESFNIEQINQIWHELTHLAIRIPNEKACSALSLGISSLTQLCKASSYNIGEDLRHFLADESQNLNVIASILQGIYQWINSSYIDEKNAFYAQVILNGLASTNSLLFRIDMIHLLSYLKINDAILLELPEFSAKFWDLLFEITNFSDPDDLDQYFNLYPVLLNCSEKYPNFFNQTNLFTNNFIQNEINPSIPIYFRLKSILHLVLLSQFHNNEQFIQILQLFSNIFIEYFQTIGPITPKIHHILYSISSKLSFSKSQQSIFSTFLLENCQSVGPPVFFLFSVFALHLLQLLLPS